MLDPGRRPRRRPVAVTGRRLCMTESQPTNSGRPAGGSDQAIPGIATNATHFVLAIDSDAITALRTLWVRNRAAPAIEKMAVQLLREALRARGQAARASEVERLIVQTLRFHQASLGTPLAQALYARCAALWRVISETRPPEPSHGRPPRYHETASQVEAANRGRVRRGTWHVMSMFSMLLVMCLLGFVASWTLAGGLDGWLAAVLPASAWRTTAHSFPALNLVLDGGFLLGMFGAAAGSYAGVINNIASMRGRMALDKHQHYAELYQPALIWTLRLSQAFAVAKPLSAVLATVLVFVSVVHPSSGLAGLAGF